MIKDIKGFMLDIKKNYNKYYKLGLYQLISNYSKNGYQQIVSLFAIGKRDEAIRLFEQYKGSLSFILNKEKFIKDLLPFNPELSYQLLISNKLTNVFSKNKRLKISLECHLNKKIALLNSLSKLSFNDYKKTPEYWLFNNAIDSSNLMKLDNLNNFLKAFQLDAVSLNNPNKELNVKNLCCNIRDNSFKEDLPLVSILVTAFNTDEYIKPILLSLLNQTYPNIEVIVIDDKSSDKTIEKVKVLQKEYDNLVLIALEDNVGTYLAKTIGFKAANGMYAISHDSDDWAHPRKIELQMQPLLEDPNLVVSFSKWIRIDDVGVPYARPVSPLMRLNPSSALFNRKIVEQNTGLWDLVKTGSDSEFNARLKLVFPEQYVMINKPLTIGSHRSNSLMTAKDTSHQNNKLSARLAYWEAWNLWHVKEMENPKNLKIDPKNRSFFAPVEIQVSQLLLNKYL